MSFRVKPLGPRRGQSLSGQSISLWGDLSFSRWTEYWCRLRSAFLGKALTQYEHSNPDLAYPCLVPCITDFSACRVSEGGWGWRWWGQTLCNLVGGETSCRPGSRLRNTGRVMDSGPMAAEVCDLNPGFFQTSGTVRDPVTSQPASQPASQQRSACKVLKTLAFFGRGPQHPPFSPHTSNCCPDRILSTGNGPWAQNQGLSPVRTSWGIPQDKNLGRIFLLGGWGHALRVRH